MKILRQISKSIFLNGFMAYELGLSDIPQTIKEEIPNLEVPRLRSDPKYGLIDLKNICKKQPYDLVIGFSMGGVYALRIESKLTILINPGLGISEGIKAKKPEYSSGFKKLEQLPIVATNVIGIFGEYDKIRSKTEPIFVSMFGKDKVKYFPGKHIPTTEELYNYIIPTIKRSTL